jgi:hypothetical protein
MGGRNSEKGTEMRTRPTQHLALLLTLVFTAACLCGCGNGSNAEQDSSRLHADTSPANKTAPSAVPRTELPKEVVAIEQGIGANASDDSVQAQVVEAEKIIVDHIRAKGPGGRFVIKEVSAQDQERKASVCLHANPQGGAMGKTEFPGDKIRMDLSFAGIVAYGEGSRWVPNIFRNTPEGIKTTQDVPGGDGSIHRYSGAIPLGVGLDYIFIGEANAAHRLTFVVLKDIGYVYVRGKGIVKGPQGKVIQLGE